jgi:hypothetical protein
MRQIYGYFVVFALAAMAIVPATADVIYDNGDPFVTAHASDFAYPNQLADDFVLQSGASTITDIHWYGLYDTQSDIFFADIFTIRIFEDDGGAPDATALYEITGVDGNRTATGGFITIYDEYEYSVDIAPLALLANTTYWISIVNDTSNVTAGYNWYWADAGSGNSFLRATDAAAWEPYVLTPDLAFYLTGPVVPEPASMTLLGLGLVAAAVRMRRKA